MKSLGRIIARKDTCGLYIPYGENRLPEGIYEIQDIMGELQLRRVGDFHGDSKRADALDVGGLFDERISFGMTTEELKEAGQIILDFL